MKELMWVADSRSNVKAFPAIVQDDIGYALYRAQLGEMSAYAKPLHGLGSGVLEIAARDSSGTYRAVYTVRFVGVLYVLHAFQKKSTKGIATPQRHLDLVRQRLREAETIHKATKGAGA